MDRGKNIQMQITEEELEKDRTNNTRKSKIHGRRAQSWHGHCNLQSCNCDIGRGSGITDEEKESCLDGDSAWERSWTWFGWKCKKEKRRNDSETAALLAKSVSIDKKLTKDTKEFATMREGMAALKKKSKAFHSNLMVKNTPPMRKEQPIVVRTTRTLKWVRRKTARKFSTSRHS